jgi:hypothetical protein
MAFNSKPSAAPVRKPCFHIVYCGRAGFKGKLGSGATKGDGCSDFNSTELVAESLRASEVLRSMDNFKHATATSEINAFIVSCDDGGSGAGPLAQRMAKHVEDRMREVVNPRPEQEYLTRIKVANFSSTRLQYVPQLPSLLFV